MKLANLNEAVLHAPNIPFREITDAEKESIREHFRKYGIEATDIPDRYWQKTTQEGRGVVDTIRSGGFGVSREVEYGNDMDGFGAKVHVYSRKHSGLRTKKDCDHSNVIGSVDLWSSWGFVSSPVNVWYQNLGLISDSIELHKYLSARGIDFKDSVSRSELGEKIREIRKQKDEILRTLSAISTINLRS